MHKVQIYLSNEISDKEYVIVEVKIDRLSVDEISRLVVSQKEFDHTRISRVLGKSHTLDGTPISTRGKLIEYDTRFLDKI